MEWCFNTLAMFLGSLHSQMVGWVGIYRASSLKEPLKGCQFFYITPNNSSAPNVLHQTSSVPFHVS
jgi:hypothetical protein